MTSTAATTTTTTATNVESCCLGHDDDEEEDDDVVLMAGWCGLPFVSSNSSSSDGMGAEERREKNDYPVHCW